MSAARPPLSSPRRAAHIVERAIGQDLALYDPNRLRLHLLNATAACAWRLCDDGRDLAAIVALLAREYPASPETIRRDLDTLLGRLAADGLLA